MTGRSLALPVASPPVTKEYPLTIGSTGLQSCGGAVTTSGVYCGDHPHNTQPARRATFRPGDHATMRARFAYHQQSIERLSENQMVHVITSASEAISARAG